MQNHIAHLYADSILFRCMETKHLPWKGRKSLNAFSAPLWLRTHSAADDAFIYAAARALSILIIFPVVFCERQRRLHYTYYIKVRAIISIIRVYVRVYCERVSVNKTQRT